MSNVTRRWKGVLYLFLFGAGFAWLVYTGQSSPAPAWHQRIALRVVSPLLQGIRFARASLSAGLAQFSELRQVRQENLRLQQELQQAQVTQVALRETVHQLGILLDLQQSPLLAGDAGLSARVLGYDPSPTRRSLWIDRGSADGIEVDQPVVASQGVIGRVFKVGPNMAQVLLLTDVHSNIDVVDQRTRARATLVGAKKQVSLNRERWLTQAEYISSHDEVLAGDLWVTSGLDGIYPAGLPVATVSEVKKDSTGLFLAAEALPQVELSKLEIVKVLSAVPGAAKEAAIR